MKRIATILLYITVALLIAWQIPWWYNYLRADASREPFTIYSQLLGDFIVTGHDEGAITYRSGKGMQYSREEVDSLLPTFYYRQLLTDGRLPDTLYGEAVTPQLIQRGAVTFRCSPRTLSAPAVALSPLLESASRRVKLEMPEDLFRITDQAIEFVDMQSNQLDKAKSANYTKLFQEKGFAFPAQRVAGNATAQKEYDNGYLLIDQQGKLFHLKQMAGKPYLRAIDLPEGVEAAEAFVWELPSRRHIGLVSTRDHQLYLIEREGYRPCRLEIPSWDPLREDLTIIGNDLDSYTLKVSTADATSYYALDATSYTLLSSLQVDHPERAMPGLHFTSRLDGWVKPRLD